MEDLFATLLFVGIGAVGLCVLFWFYALVFLAIGVFIGTGLARGDF